jgi:protein-S-isoprenylcysteine O-methyltransferase Ste14
MNELLDALGLRRSTLRPFAAVAIWGFFGLGMLVLAGGQALFEEAVGVNAVGTVVIVTIVWAAWTYWHSVLFLRHREKYVVRLSMPYRRAFVVDLIPGLTISFSQMLRSAVNGPNLRTHAVIPRLPHSAAADVRFAIGTLLILVAFTLFETAWRTLGTARVGFVPEFVEPESFTPLRKGPYAHVRHPLFWSGITFSFALALLCHTGVALAVAVVNGCYGLVYNALEDRRLRLVFGERYGIYAREVPRIVPSRLRASK